MPPGCLGQTKTIYEKNPSAQCRRILCIWMVLLGVQGQNCQANPARKVMPRSLPIQPSTERSAVEFALIGAFQPSSRLPEKPFSDGDGEV